LPQRTKDNGFVFRRGQNVFNGVAFTGGFKLVARRVSRRFPSRRHKRAGFLVGNNDQNREGAKGLG